MEETRVHALDYLTCFRSRKRRRRAPIIASIGVGALLVRFLPKQYRASATLAVTAPGVSTNLVNQNTQFDNQERTRAVSQQLLSTTVLSRVARAEGLT